MAKPVSDSVPPLVKGNNNNGSLIEEFISGLVQGGSWAFGDRPRTLTYSFDLNFDGPVEAFDEKWMRVIGKAFQAWENVANIRFSGFGEPNAVAQNLSEADIAISLSPEGRGGVAGIGLFPDPRFADLLLEQFGYSRTGGAFPVPRPEGDITFNSNHFIFDTLAPGGQGFYVLLHEIGHALGLKHTDDNGGNRRPTFGRLGIGAYEDARYTIMEGREFPEGDIPSSPMLLDILAIQHIYGANMSYRTGNDTYKLGQSYRVIWDAGGIDTLSGRSLDKPGMIGVVIDLRDGSFSGYESGDRYDAIAFNTVIENAIGTRTYDELIGNNADNRLNGGGASDVMRGGRGNDTYVVDLAQDRVIESARRGTDTILSRTRLELPDNVENLTLLGTRSIAGIGNELGNLLKGNAGRNELDGADGDDTLQGGGGRDTLIGGAGDDTYILDEAQDSIIEMLRPQIRLVAPHTSSSPHISGDGRYVAFELADAGIIDPSSDLDVVVVELATGSMVEASISMGLPDGRGSRPMLSSDGRYVVFQSDAANLVAGDSFGSDIFVRDLELDVTTKVSVRPSGADIGTGSFDPAISGDGRYVTFITEQSALVADDLGDDFDVFLKDLQTGTLTLVSSSPGGYAAVGESARFSMGGRYVIFTGGEGDAEAPGAVNDIFVKDLETGSVTLVSVATDGTRGNGHSFSGSISADGRYAVFASNASNLVEGDTNGKADIFLRDLQENTLTRISTGPNGEQAIILDSFTNLTSARISPDGRFATFAMSASNLVAGDTNGHYDVFVKNLETGAVERISVSAEGEQAVGSSLSPSFTDDGRYISFTSGATNLTGGRGTPYTLVAPNPFLDGEFLSDPGGNDTIRSSITCHLPDGIEQLVLTGQADIDGTGNDLRNMITGNSGDNVLDGGEDVDTVSGGSGADTLVWDADDALADGGGDADTLQVIGDLDLTAIADEIIVNIEQIDLSAGASTLTIAESDILAMSPAGLKILGDGEDTVTISGGYTEGAEADGFVTYTVGTATLLVDADIEVA